MPLRAARHALRPPADRPEPSKKVEHAWFSSLGIVATAVVASGTVAPRISTMTHAKEPEMPVSHADKLEKRLKGMERDVKKNMQAVKKVNTAMPKLKKAQKGAKKESD